MAAIPGSPDPVSSTDAPSRDHRAPSNLGLKETGVDQLASALLHAGLAESISAHRAGRVQPGPYDSARDPVTGMLNTKGIREFTLQLAEVVGGVLRAGEFPVVLGGDCSILLGSLLARRRDGRHGLLFLDGHADFYQPEANINGEAASSELALATGRGPRELTAFDDFPRLVRDEDVVVCGSRDQQEQAAYRSQPLPPAVLELSLAEIRRRGAAAAAQAALVHLMQGSVDNFWIHLDADVLSDEIMPAVDYRQPDGLSWAELDTILGAALRSERAAGLEVTIFNPRLDRDGSITRAFTDALVRNLSPLTNGS